MDNQTILIGGAIVIGICALIFFTKVKVKLGQDGVSVEGSDDKKIVSNVKDSKRVDLTQRGSSESNVEGSEDVTIRHE